MEFVYKMPMNGSIILCTSEEIGEMEASRRGVELIHQLAAEENLDWTLVQAGTVFDIGEYYTNKKARAQTITLKGLTIGRAELIDKSFDKANGE